MIPKAVSCPCFLYNCFKNSFIPDLNGLCPDLLALIEIEVQQIALVNVIIVEILPELLLAALVIFLPAPDLHFNDKLCAEIVDNQVSAALIAGLCLDIILMSQLSTCWRIVCRRHQSGLCTSGHYAASIASPYDTRPSKQNWRACCVFLN